ncbi:phosphatase PAP2 family protein [Methylibium sp.]|uniref:phosphatase PAP2 family protein n=1 Tax=Methylibium sp. TaxID=2067992 RepID=UPI003D0A67F0
MPRPEPSRLPTAQRDLLLALAGLALLMLWDGSGLDLALLRLVGNADGFPWREHWLTAGLLHRGGRWLSVALFTLTVAVAVWPFGPWRGLTPRERLWCLGVTLICLLLIPLLKRHSLTSCPWELQEFGGVAHYVSHWRFGVADGGPGHCFPSGHASGAFSFLALAVVLRAKRPAVARSMLIALCVIGALFGFAQMARGAHYLSHTLYTAWLCGSLTALSWHALMQPAAPRQPQPQGLPAD